MKKIIKNKKLIIVTFLLILMGLILIGCFGKGSPDKGSQTNYSSQDAGSASQSEVTGTPKSTAVSPKAEKVPKEIKEKIEKEAEQLPNTSDYIVKETKDYGIAYFDNDNAFLITIFASPFEEKRTIAEDAFLESLDITQEEACNLTVYITTTMHANPNEASKDHYLSFCEKND
jgi:hypothetical protein